ncbi:hypothetical protein AADZ90_021430 [Aestuariibius sp. 2305UL40-4]|uniref:hypothetical protein n=1 Tax=Aestuariibius violaceus TaxID=3234132 RepID=UPI00345EE937
MKATIERARPLINVIYRHESRGDYNVVWGRIRPEHRPKRPLTSMTIGEVLDWQDSIDPLYMSEAAGAGQFLEDTLRDIYDDAGFDRNDLFNEEAQDALVLFLLRRRGFQRFLNGRLSTEAFANNLAKEWASLPVVTGAKKGRSYYAGDGLNKAHAGVDEILHAIGLTKQPLDTRIVAPKEVEDLVATSDKSPLESTTNLAAMVSALVTAVATAAGSISDAVDGLPLPVAIGAIVISAGAAVWIVRERSQKAALARAARS